MPNVCVLKRRKWPQADDPKGAVWHTATAIRQSDLGRLNAFNLLGESSVRFSAIGIPKGPAK